MSTVLCFMPPRPADWMRWEKPSLRLEDTTTWQKPLVLSVDMADLMFLWDKGNIRPRKKLSCVCARPVELTVLGLGVQHSISLKKKGTKCFDGKDKRHK